MTYYARTCDVIGYNVFVKPVMRHDLCQMKELNYTVAKFRYQSSILVKFVADSFRQNLAIFLQKSQFDISKMYSSLYHVLYVTCLIHATLFYKNTIYIK